MITWVIFIAPAVTIGWKLFSFLNRYEARIIKLEHDSADNKKRDEEYREQAQREYDARFKTEMEKYDLKLSMHEAKDETLEKAIGKNYATLEVKIDRNKETANERFDKVEKKIDALRDEMKIDNRETGKRLTALIQQRG